MGEAKRKKVDMAPLEDAVGKVGSALRRLATAASGSFGSDCFMHAEMGRLALEELGFKAVRKSGFAAWRLGAGDGDVISHTEEALSYLPPGTEGLPYHTWLEVSGYIVDFTTYQLRHKAEELDAADGGHTNVDWCPDVLIINKHHVMTYRQVAQAATPPAVYYEARSNLDDYLASKYTIDPQDYVALRILMFNQSMQVMGPNDIES
ncbi:probable malate:quinone oxidoreductase [Novimethylophilus kurashikiensis]|uniref:Probable malate:quinone oxidoreductase n=1 Tax=Novimethylophilus kurashikiensis TaxID=1825523 RepID=A0A2R5FCS4_9PROT|nr:hypothetical protein [Novimethylophilus kurashikiensis]GBG14444.1 probable malate:quinone oxidoreductase [Novimethylophilus kurashikiensis]